MTLALLSLLSLGLAVLTWPQRCGPSPVRQAPRGDHREGPRAGPSAGSGEGSGGGIVGRALNPRGDVAGHPRELQITTAAVTGATPHDVADALVLLALALRVGVGPVEALEQVARSSSGPIGAQLSTVAAGHRWGLAPDEAWAQVPDVWQHAALAWRVALEAGAAPAELIEGAARRLRDIEDRRVESATMRAGVLLVLPLGLAFLPAFACTTVVPVVVTLARALLSG